jgi:hypothetical protein
VNSTSKIEPENNPTGIGSAQAQIRNIAASQIENYLRQPAELVGHFNRELSALDGYRGRQLLELLQNADDAGVDATGGCSLLLSLSRQRLVTANTGKVFSPKGLTSLVVSDCSPKQLDRNRFIGCKGLGFRSVLTWTDRPLISSGTYEVCFARAHAEGVIRELAEKSRAVSELVAPFRDATGQWPAAIMRFPDVPSDLDPRLVEARAFRELGYDTVIVLPLHEGVRGAAVYDEMLVQLSGLPTSSLLFCRNLTRVEVVGDFSRAWDLEREDHGADKSTVVLQQNGTTELWNVYRHSGLVTAEASEASSGRRRDFEVAVAVPDDTMFKSDGNLCVFFPTHDRLPCALVMHATLETTDDRNRLVANESNREVLTHLAVHVAGVLEGQTELSEPRRALELLAGLEHADPELKILGFVDALIRECASRKIFPRLDGRLESADCVRKVPHKVWLSQLDLDVFPELLVIGPDDRLRGLLTLFAIAWYDPETLRDRLKHCMLTLDRSRAGQVLGRLLADGQLISIGASGLLMGADGKLISEGDCFFTPVEKLPILPLWAFNVRFVDEAFQAGLLRGSDAAGLRYLASDLSRAKCDVDEYRFDTVSRALINEVERGVQDDAVAKLGRWQQLLRWLFDASSNARQSLALLPIKLPTTNGGLRRATNCYLGPDYPTGELVYRLYRQFGLDEFVAAPGVCGFDGVALRDAEEFLVAIGTNASPRMEILQNDANYQRFKRAVIERLDYPRTIRDRLCANEREVREWISDYSIENLSYPIVGSSC